MNTNAIEFVLKMKDMMSGTIQRAANQGQSSFNKMSQFAQQATGKNQILGMSFSELQSRIKQTEDLINKSTIPKQINEAKRELHSLQQMAIKHAGNSDSSSSSSSKGIGIGGIAIGSMVGNLASQGIGMLIGGVKDGVGAMVSQAMNRETAISGMSTFIGKPAATEAYKNIRSDANATPFDTNSLLAVNKALISTGLDAKSARTDTMNLANAIVAVGGGNDELSRMSANMAQIKQSGKATAMDIRQFAMAGINIYEMLHKSTGKSIEQVREMDVTYEQLAKSMAQAREKGGMYYHALENSNATMAGQWSNFKDQMMTGLSDIGTAFAPVILKIISLGVQFSNGIAPMIERAKPYIEAISNGFGTAVDYISNITNGTSEWSSYVNTIKEFFNHMWVVVQHIGLKLWAMVSSMVEFIKKSEMMKDIFKFVMWVAEKIADVISIVVDSVVWLWEHVLKPIFEKLDKVYKWIKEALGFGDKEIKVTKTLVAPKKPKDDGKGAPAPSGVALAMSNADAGKKAGDSVVGGGPRNITIQVSKFFDTIQFTTMDGKESAQELEKVVLEALGRVLYNGAKLV
jgi:tape measure domain-containing protein